MNTYKATGIVIGRRALGEADRLLTIFTKQWGKKIFLAKGVRKITSRRAPYIELFSHISFVARRGKSLDLLIEVASVDQFPMLRSRLGRIGHAYVVSELIDKMTGENQEHQAVYDLCYDFFCHLDTPLLTLKSADIRLTQFKLALLSTLGFVDESQKDIEAELNTIIRNLLERDPVSYKLLPHLY